MRTGGYAQTIARLSNLRSLDLGRTQISEQGLETLRKSLVGCRVIGRP